MLFLKRYVKDEVVDEIFIQVIPAELWEPNEGKILLENINDLSRFGEEIVKENV